MTARRTGDHLFDDVLEQLDRADVSPARRPVQRVLRAAWHRMPSRVRNAILTRLHRRHVDTATFGLGPAAGDLGSRRFFYLPISGGWSGIRINLVGREPRGKVHPGTECEALCEKLTAELMDMKNAATGRPVVHQVLRTAREYRGERIDNLPDLMVEWSRDAEINGVTSPRIETVTGADTHSRTGDHLAGGLLLARGPGVRAGPFGKAVPVESLAPSIAALLGVALPDADEQPVAELVGLGTTALVAT
jgi:hypothetical protein